MNIFFAAILAGIGCSCYATDLTRQPNAFGPDVVEAVVNIIRESCLFADDKRFLRRLAYVESQDGSALDAFRPGYYGGIWQVDRDAFIETQNKPALQMYYNIIRDKMGINWNSVQWTDLRKPLYSGIAAALYTQLKSAPNTISWKKEEQGQFWASYFHSGSSAANFSQLAGILDLGCKLHQKVDLVFVIDSSSSLTPSDFDRAKIFMKEVVDGFDISPAQAQVGLVVYSSNANIQFYLNSHKDKSSLEHAIDSATYTPGATQTGLAIEKAVDYVYNPTYGARDNVVKVMIIITDGDSDDSISTRDAALKAHANSIVTFSVGVGSQIHSSELHTLASNPSCTHTYQASSYQEIRFMKEEIQKATCIAPLYINKTYSCEIGECPPLAVLTGHHGVTMQTKVSCGGVNVYSSFANPYPSSAQFEVVQNTLTGQPQAYYFSEKDNTLYINMKDNQISANGHNGSAGCIATITPCFGNCETISVKCYKGSVEIPCIDSYFNCTEKWNFNNPCTDEAIKTGHLRFPHPYFNNKFLLCDKTKKVYVAICPPGEVFVALCSQCIGESTLAISTDCKTPLPTSVTNPCTAENILADKMFFPYPGSVVKYIHCDVWGKPWERQCQNGMEWDQSLVTCIRISTFNPCVHHVPGDPFLYPHQCDPHKYIHCDTNHQSFVQSCQFDYVFLKDSRTCVPIGSYPGTEHPVNTCHGGTTPYYPVAQATTNQPVTPSYQYETGPTNSYGYVYSNTRYAAPCTPANIAANQLYFAYAYNIHQYIQCDLYGNMYLQDCSRSGRDYWDPYAITCVDGPVFVDGILTRPTYSGK